MYGTRGRLIRVRENVYARCYEHGDMLRLQEVRQLALRKLAIVFFILFVVGLFL